LAVPFVGGVVAKLASDDPADGNARFIDFARLDFIRVKQVFRQVAACSIAVVFAACPPVAVFVALWCFYLVLDEV
jgi:hypothetical protein